MDAGEKSRVGKGGRNKGLTIVQVEPARPTLPPRLLMPPPNQIHRLHRRTHTNMPTMLQNTALEALVRPPITHCPAQRPQTQRQTRPMDQNPHHVRPQRKDQRLLRSAVLVLTLLELQLARHIRIPPLEALIEHQHALRQRLAAGPGPTTSTARGPRALEVRRARRGFEDAVQLRDLDGERHAARAPRRRVQQPVGENALVIQVFRQRTGELPSRARGTRADRRRAAVDHAQQLVEREACPPDALLDLAHAARVVARRRAVQLQAVSDAHREPEGVPALVGRVGALQVARAEQEGLDLRDVPVVQQGRGEQGHSDVVVAARDGRVGVLVHEAVGEADGKDHVQQGQSCSVSGPFRPGRVYGGVEGAADCGLVEDGTHAVVDVEELPYEVGRFVGELVDGRGWKRGVVRGVEGLGTQPQRAAVHCIEDELGEGDATHEDIGICRDDERVLGG